MALQWILFILASGAIALVTFLLRKLTLNGALLGFGIGLMIFAAFQWAGVAFMFLFFIVSVLATSIGKKSKKDAHGPREAGQVFANAGMALLLSLTQFILYAKEELLVLVACAFSSAIADTVSSEIGQVYGKKFYNILSFKKDIRGENGVISMEGMITGIIASVLMATLSYLFYPHYFWVIVVAGTIGNITDSILGATVERRGFLQNNDVNFLNTLVAVIAGFLLLLTTV